MARFRQLLRDTVIVVLIALSLLSIAELALRIIYQEKVLAYQFNPDYLVSLKPNVRKVFKRSSANGGGVVHWRTNSDSFRGLELEAKPDLRVIVYGDSNIQARFSSLEKTFPARLQHYLSLLYKRKVEVVNAGVVGFGPDQSLLQCSGEIGRYKPDLAVFQIFADNDFGDIVRNRLFELDDHGLLTRSKHKPTVDQEIKGIRKLLLTKAVDKLFRALVRRSSGSAADQSFPVEKTIEIGLSVSEKEYSIYARREPRVFSHFADHYDFDVSLHPNSEQAKTKVLLLERILEKTREVAAEHGVEPLFLIQPSSRDLSSNLPVNYHEMQKYPGYRRNGLSSIVEGICARHQLHCVNLFRSFLSGD